ncbi:MAG: hypothetical protein US83_C0007G0041 [Candidatus Falkowbacteria bacterium GW2011_GWC2_38_22]|uniref:Type II secretion system protein GspG C-terminal domain-containing protein n=1 Tax=Candidatus Falkowbacteria bacterium GW2011_GWE1_38_31 TaxID=1618638 RepID=A0A0G0MYB6_9BACT|nr:MAG: hypothetical protein US73_C0008G0016 [Candidatus Falkowbacteria bacterium GW2011_GWF2_38_1205]KKQ61305.1 MAG: hypothetical protein US83_C0007G0041 [Candidatus Falkowbacteria bacterium GW2011_GWC2_38_22]KKQ63123.1 MAG: hypothetical protein US84_C0008G0016 [Candidatus Falkowbacteria bacterium GW2011_GWF1_38_22]KKQ65320.1 MAG: hypothetical protein US87_C0008G0016 [Candidatus Falkowbacteria bacterium GW2011_GWE2_38_254]KKQ69896.1 MAG: hypothetical protein US91_C0008G0016 [Candidatus Falkowb
MKQTLTPKQKNKIYLYSAGGFIFVLFLVLTMLGIYTVSRQSRDIIRLSDLSRLQTDLLMFYKEKNIYPARVLVRSEVKRADECERNLCLDEYPLDPKTNERYVYTPCQDVAGEYCEAGFEDAKGFIINYRLEIGSGSVKKGAHRVKAGGLVN